MSWTPVVLGGTDRLAHIESAVAELKSLILDLRDLGVPLDGATDGQAQLQQAFTNNGPGVYVVPAGYTLAIASTLTIPDRAVLALGNNATVKWTGAAGGTMFATSSAVPTLLAGVVSFGRGRAIIDPNSSADIVFDLHSTQVCEFSGLKVLTGRTSTIVFKLRGDAAATTGSLSGNTNVVSSTFKDLVVGRCAKVIEATGQSGGVVTLNRFENINALDVQGTFIDLLDYADSNTFTGPIRAKLNANNAIGVNFATANVYNNYFDHFAPDTFVGLTGRVAVKFGSGSSRNRIMALFNNPRAEGAVITDNGASSYYVGAHSLDTTASDTSALEVYELNVSHPYRNRALTYGATIATNAGQADYFTIVATNGTAFTISNPTITSYKRITYDIKNSSGGAMGAITWGAAFLLAGAFTNPANGKRRTISFNWDGTNWVEESRAAADI